METSRLYMPLLADLEMDLAIDMSRVTALRSRRCAGPPFQQS
jgi:hypothetical protein